VALLDEFGDERTLAEMLDMLAEGRPGRGGITRGRGDAPMTWSGGTAEENAKFKPQVVPPASVADLRRSTLAGVSRGRPGTGKPESSTGGALTGAEAGGGSAHTRVILPRHRGTVKRYFERGPADGGGKTD
jgi:hypothetical protein